MGEERDGGGRKETSDQVDQPIHTIAAEGVVMPRGTEKDCKRWERREDIHHPHHTKQGSTQMVSIDSEYINIQ